MVNCRKCLFWGPREDGISGECYLIESDDGGDLPEDKAMILVEILDDTGLSAKLITGSKFSCSLGTLKSIKKT